MRLSKSTTILINVVLVLAIAILAKSFIAVPQNVNAQEKKEYFVKSADTLKGAQGILNEQARDGWRLTFAQYAWDRSHLVLIMER
jgi:hypothetical protein